MSDETLGEPRAHTLRLRGDRTRFGLLARLFHWTTPLLLIGSFGLIWSAAWLPPGPNTWAIVNLHRAIGILVLTLTVLRVLWRAADRQPDRIGPWPLRRGARLVHAALYALLICTPLLGWSYTNARGHGLYVFGVALPSLIFKDEYLARLAIAWHEWFAYTLLALIGLHLLAALWHQFALRDGTLRRMWRG
jgi:cytochrome b561